LNGCTVTKQYGDVVEPLLITSVGVINSFLLGVVHEGGVLGRCVNPDGRDSDGSARRPENEGGDGALGGAWNHLHRGTHLVDGHQPGAARRAVSS
jgi:hypothetical protein